MMRLLQVFFVMMVLSLMPLNTVFAGDAATQKAIIQVDGLSCPFCAYGLEKNLKKVKGITSVDIDIKTGKATVTMQSNAAVTDKSLRQAIKKAGFTARGISRD